MTLQQLRATKTPKIVLRQQQQCRRNDKQLDLLIQFKFNLIIIFCQMGVCHGKFKLCEYFLATVNLDKGTKFGDLCLYPFSLTLFLLQPLNKIYPLLIALLFNLLNVLMLCPWTQPISLKHEGVTGNNLM